MEPIEVLISIIMFVVLVYGIYLVLRYVIRQSQGK